MGKLSGVPKPSRIGGGIGCHAKQFVLWSRRARRTCYLLRHPRRVVLQERNLIQGNIEERVFQFASESLLVGGLRLIEAIQRDIVEHEEGVGGEIVRI